MDVKCYIAVFVFSALATVLGYMICVRLRTKAVGSCPLQVDAAAVATAPLLAAKAS